MLGTNTQPKKAEGIQFCAPFCKIFSSDFASAIRKHKMDGAAAVNRLSHESRAIPPRSFRRAFRSRLEFIFLGSLLKKGFR